MEGELSPERLPFRRMVAARADTLSCEDRRHPAASSQLSHRRRCVGAWVC